MKPNFSIFHRVPPSTSSTHSERDHKNKIFAEIESTHYGDEYVAHTSILTDDSKNSELWVIADENPISFNHVPTYKKQK